MDFDYIIIGSGFGGSVSALRLSEKGYRVAVLEQGRRVTPDDMRAASTKLTHLLWMPALGLKGYFAQTFFRHLNIVGGVGVGGGSLVYAAVLLKPQNDFFRDPAWNNLGVDWQTELAPHYATAQRMLGVVNNPHHSTMDEYLKRTADAMGVGATFDSVPVGIYFGEPGKTASDPFFDGKGPARTGCDFSGECLTGCVNGSKNSLDFNYLHLAEKLGAQVLPERQATLIRPIDGGYQVEIVNPIDKRTKYAPLTARNVVLAAGVLGTLTLLFRCRDEFKTLPNISPQLGKVVRTNSEAIVGILSRKPDIDLTDGTTISSHFYPDAHTHITQNRFPRGYTFMKWYSGPLVDDAHQLRRALKTLATFLRHPLHSTIAWRASNATWHKRISTLTVMQHLDNQIAFRYGRGLFTLFRKGLQSVAVPGKSAPTYLPIANQAARVFAEQNDGDAGNVIMETLANLGTTAHILGGCHMGKSADDGVIDSHHEVFNYPGLFIVDGSAISANVGVNPSLTITALAERCMSKIERVY